MGRNVKAGIMNLAYIDNLKLHNLLTESYVFYMMLLINSSYFHKQY